MSRKKITRVGLGVLTAFLVLNAALWLAEGVFSYPGPRSVTSQIFGLSKSVVRAELVVRERGATKAYRLDRGRVVARATNSITLRERDGLVVMIPIAPSARITVDGYAGSIFDAARGMRAETLRVGDRAAERVRLFSGGK